MDATQQISAGLKVGGRGRRCSAGHSILEDTLPFLEVLRSFFVSSCAVAWLVVHADFRSVALCQHPSCVGQTGPKTASSERARVLAVMLGEPEESEKVGDETR